MSKSVFKEKELKILKALIKYGPQKPSAIARIINLPRASVYGYLSKLSKRGVVISFISNGTKSYKICSKLDLEARIENEIKSNINDLTSLKSLVSSLFMTNKIDYSSEIITYENIEDIKYQYLNMLDDSKNIKTFVNLSVIDNKLVSFFSSDYMDKKLKNNVKSKVLISSNGEVRELIKLRSKKHLRDQKFFNMQLPFYFFINILNDYVLILLPNLVLVKIKNYYIRDFLDDLHDHIWCTN